MKFKSTLAALLLAASSAVAGPAPMSAPSDTARIANTQERAV